MTFWEAMEQVCSKFSWLIDDHLKHKDLAKRQEGHEFLYAEAQKLMKIPPSPGPSPKPTEAVPRRESHKVPPPKKTEKSPVPIASSLDYKNDRICNCPTCRRELVNA